MSKPSSPWFESSYGKNEQDDIRRDRANSQSSTGNNWIKFRQFFNFSTWNPSIETEERLTIFRYII